MIHWVDSTSSYPKWDLLIVYPFGSWL